MTYIGFDNPIRKHKLRAEVKARFGGCCGYCGIKAKRLTLDHVVAKSKGGLDLRSNLVAVCPRCNRSKGSRELWAWWQASPWWCEVRAAQLAEQVLVCRVKR